ncbi:hypothetical protein [Nocardia jinanensis]|uniref:Uncharacterized protein n=1 Tax=Nocardia jinanensis TaxID=382504 RepID=A0A917RWN5_9NOCA|nr:hypothetical protein [Nocardia jinanensis]GGL40550.1 hypothetical protein GCM10011588_64110 [Nocardia jinanensis]
MVNIVSLDAVKAIVGDAAGALTVMTDDVGTTVDSLVLASKADSPLDRDMTGKLDWIRDTFAAAASDVAEQSGITVEATGYGTTVLADADLDGGVSVRSTAV